MAQWKRAGKSIIASLQELHLTFSGLITRRSYDRNIVLLQTIEIIFRFFFFLATSSSKRLFVASLLCIEIDFYL
jgi:hypothetical protein